MLFYLVPQRLIPLAPCGPGLASPIHGDLFVTDSWVTLVSIAKHLHQVKEIACCWIGRNAMFPRCMEAQLVLQTIRNRPVDMLGRREYVKNDRNIQKSIP